MKRSDGEKRSNDISGAELITTIGLIVYCSVASLGLFINVGFSNPLLYLWLFGYVFLILTLLYSSYISPKPLNKFSFIVLGVIALNLLVQVNGGVNSFLWSVYFLYVVLVAALSPSRWTYATVGLILIIETANLVVPRHETPARWDTYAGFALSLACLAVAVVLFRTRERKTREAHERLIAHASAIDPLSDETKLASITQEGRKTANVKAALERQNAFDGLVEIIDQTVHAHTYALFLVETTGNGEALILRAIRSRSEYGTRRVGEILVESTDVAVQRNIIDACARDKRVHYYPEMGFPSMNLGYYSTNVPVQSFLTLPIVQEGRAIGVLAVDSLERDAFPPEVQDVLENSAPSFVQIIKNIQVSQDLDIEALYFRALHKMSADLNSSLELGDILEHLTGQINEMAPYDLCVFVRYDDEANEAVVIHRSGPAAASVDTPSYLGNIASTVKSLMGGREEEKEEVRFPVEQSGILSQRLKQWRVGRVLPHHDPDLGDRGKDIPLFGEALRLRQQIRSLSLWPLVSGDKFVGACFLGAGRPNAFSELQRNVLDTLMNQVAVVMANALLHRQVLNMALTDGLTGLLNHRTFMEKLAEEFNRLDREPQPFSLLLLDIDHFKKINDTYGHPIGDVALKTVAGIVKKSVRNIDFVARYGGEEFVVGMVSADSKDADQTAERIRKSVENTLITSGKHAFKCTLSIGVATLKPGREKKEDLLGRADIALYHAKRTGRNRVSLYENLTEADTQTAQKQAGAASPKALISPRDPAR
jgi:diguanylate cyclase (GGDEF)-like protein